MSYDYFRIKAIATQQLSPIYESLITGFIRCFTEYTMLPELGYP